MNGLFFVVLIGLLSAQSAFSSVADNPNCPAKHPWCNLSLSFQQRATLLANAMNFTEKIQQISTFTPKSPCPGIPRLDLPPFPYHSEGLHGLRDAHQDLQVYSTMFPQVTAMAATGNITLIREMAKIMAYEARALNNLARKQHKLFPKGAGLFYWSPTMNIGRDPRWGRFQESISEDPWLNGAYSAAFVDSFQKPHGQAESKYNWVAATCKHYFAYSLEKADGYTRHTFNAIVSEQDLQETYLPGFKTCVEEGHPGLIMCAYPSINGIPACLHKDEISKARTQWGFEGFVVSDEGAINDVFHGHHYVKTGWEATQLAIQAGCDQNCGRIYYDNGEQARTQGNLTEGQVTQALIRILTQRFAVGAFDPDHLVPGTSLGPSTLQSAAHIAVAQFAAEQAVVLLKNEQSVLPIQSGSSQQIAVIGPLGNSTYVMFGGKSDYSPGHVVSLLEGLTIEFPNILFSEGSNVQGPLRDGIHHAVETAKRADVVIMAVGIDGKVEHEGMDRKRIDIPEPQQTLLDAVLKVCEHKKKIMVIMNGGPLAIDTYKGQFDGILEGLELGQRGGTALANIITGKVNPSGVLPFSMYPEHFVDQIAMDNMTMSAYPGHTYRFLQETPLYPFGFGLSYTSFEVKWVNTSNLAGDIVHQLTTSEIHSTPNNVMLQQLLDSTATVKNTGPVGGAKVVQAYISFKQPGQPKKNLFGMQKVYLSPGQTKTLHFTEGDVIPKRWCTFCSVVDGIRAVRPGMYAITIGDVGGEYLAGEDGNVLEMRLQLVGQDVLAPL